MKGKRPGTVDRYLAAVDPDPRAALERLRRAVRAAAPEAVECLAYGIPGFRLGGKYLVGFGATSRHCSFYPGAAAVAKHARALARYGTSKGTVRFPAERPLPEGLVRRLVRARMAAIAD